MWLPQSVFSHKEKILHTPKLLRPFEATLGEMLGERQADIGRLLKKQNHLKSQQLDSSTAKPPGKSSSLLQALQEGSLPERTDKLTVLPGCSAPDKHSSQPTHHQNKKPRLDHRVTDQQLGLCPICGLEVPMQQLQAHVEAELTAETCGQWSKPPGNDGQQLPPATGWSQPHKQTHVDVVRQMDADVISMEASRSSAAVLNKAKAAGWALPSSSRCGA